MIFANPLGLLALLAVPAIIAIHLFRRRFSRRPVAGLFLWRIDRQSPEGGGRIVKPPITRSLILECVAALALALILAGARIASTGVTQHLVALLDDSASMAAVNARGESTRDRAIGRILREIEALGSTGRVTLIQSGERPAVLAGPAVFALEARTALASWTPQASHHSLALGIRFARELAGRTGRLLVVSDLTPDARGEPAFEGGLWVAVGESLPNVGITEAQRTLSPADGRGAISLTLTNGSDRPARRRLTLSAAGKEVLARDVEVPAGVSSLHVPVPTGLPAVRASLSDDALARDNGVDLVEPRPQIVAIRNRLREGRGHDALEKAVESLAGVTAAEPGHLVFLDASELDRAAPASAWRVGFGEPPSAWRSTGASTDYIGPFVIEKRHPLLQGVTLGGVAWTGAVPLAAGILRPVVSTEDRLLVGVSAAPGAGAEPAIFFNLDLERTNLIRSPDWPIVISNLVEMRRRSLPGPERWNYRVGEWIRVRLPRDPQRELRIRCGPVDRVLPSSRELEFVAPSPGGLLQLLDGDEVLFELGVNFLDESETDLRRQATRDLGALDDVPGLRAEGGAPSDPLFWVLLCVGSAALAANWWLLPRPQRA